MVSITKNERSGKILADYWFPVQISKSFSKRKLFQIFFLSVFLLSKYSIHKSQFSTVKNQRSGSSLCYFYLRCLYFEIVFRIKKPFLIIFVSCVLFSIRKNQSFAKKDSTRRIKSLFFNFLPECVNIQPFFTSLPIQAILKEPVFA